jgi:hypothetical protein
MVSSKLLAKILREDEKEAAMQAVGLSCCQSNARHRPRLDCKLTKPRQKLLRVDNKTSDTSMLNIFLNVVCIVMPIEWRKEDMHPSAG